MMGLAQLLMAAVAALDPAVGEVGVLNGGRHSRQEVANEVSGGDLAKELSEVLGTENRIGFRHCGLSIGSPGRSATPRAVRCSRGPSRAGGLSGAIEVSICAKAAKNGHGHQSSRPLACTVNIHTWKGGEGGKEGR